MNPVNPSAVPAPPAASPAQDKAGIEEWLKRASICLALLYVNGYVAFRAYAITLGLTPADFSMEEKDFLIQGVRYLILDSEVILHPRMDHWPYYTFVLVTLLMMFLGIYVAFIKLAVARPWKMLSYVLFLLALFIGLSIVAANHGVYRARLLAQSFDQLPQVYVAYESPESKDSLNYVAAQLLTRTDKVICLVNVTEQDIGTNAPYLTQNDRHLLVIKSDKIVRIQVAPPPLLNPVFPKESK